MCSSADHAAGAPRSTPTCAPRTRRSKTMCLAWQRGCWTVSERLDRSADPKRPQEPSRNDDRHAGKGTASPPIGSIVGDAEDGYANDSPMETTKTVSTGLWKSRKEREIPTFAQPRLVLVKKRRTEDQRTTTRSTTEGLGRHAPWWPVLKCRSMAGFQVSTEGLSTDRVLDQINAWREDLINLNRN